MVNAWTSRDVSIVLPLERARAMCRRAEQYDISRGGRVDRRGASVLLWSAGELSADAAPVGLLYLHWHVPTAQQGEVYRLDWDVVASGSEVEVMAAIAVLLGEPARRPPRRPSGKLRRRPGPAVGIRQRVEEGPLRVRGCGVVGRGLLGNVGHDGSSATRPTLRLRPPPRHPSERVAVGGPRTPIGPGSAPADGRLRRG